MGFMWLLLFILLGAVDAQKNYSCTCDTTLANVDPMNTCQIQFAANGENSVKHCTCKDSDYVNFWTNNTGTYLASCEPSAPWLNVTRCNTEILSSTWHSVTKWAIVGTSAFVIIIAFVVIFMNCKSKGQHRTLQMLEEIVMVVLFLAMGILQFFFIEKSGPCKVITIITQFTMTMLSALFLMEGYFAQGMINYRKPKDAGMGTIMHLLIPIVIALICSGATYALQHKNYGVSMLSCHAVTNVGMMYGFIIPVWILIFFAGVMAQRGLLKCKKIGLDSDEMQVYWGYKSAKSLVPFSTLIATIYVLIMFGLDQQRFYVLLFAALLNVVLAFYLYASHTFCYKELAMKKAPGPGGIYRQCPDPNKKSKNPNDSDSDDDSTKKEDPKDSKVHPMPDQPSPPQPNEPLQVEQPPKV